MTVNQDIRDDLISHDIDLRKLDGDARNTIDGMLDEMEKELKVKIVEIDPFTPTNTKVKEARLVRLDVATAPIIRDTYIEINKLIDERGKSVDVAESKLITDTIHDNTPQTGTKSHLAQSSVCSQRAQARLCGTTERSRQSMMQSNRNSTKRSMLGMSNSACSRSRWN